MKKLIVLFALATPLFSSAQCIDESLINPEAICLGIWAPVCGCNGVTYGNSCEAQNIGGVTEWTEGECQQGGICMDLTNVDFGPCDMWLGYAIFNGQCTGLSGCGYIVGGEDYTPYFFENENDCVASCEGMPLCMDLEGIDFGLCAMWLGFANINGQCTSMSGCGYVVDEVDYSPYFFEEESDCITACGAIDSCIDVADVDFGFCGMWLGYTLVNGTCTGLGGCGYIVEGVDYSPAFYSSLSECFQSCGQAQDCINEWQQEQGELIDCIGDWNPVCGCDGITYANSCVAFFSGGVVTYAQGECSKTEENCQAIPAIIDFGDCEMALGWAFTENGCVMTSGCGYVGQNGYNYSAYFFESEYQCVNSCIDEVIIECINEDQIDLQVQCPAIFQPVCGCDNVTYPNDCVAYNHNGVTSWTMGECQTASAGNTDKNELSVYPNPVQSLLNISFAKTFKGNLLTIYDLTGKTVLQQKINTSERLVLDISNLSTGMYILECKANDGTAVRQQIIKE